MFFCNFDNREKEESAKKDCADLIRRCNLYEQSNPDSKFWMSESDSGNTIWFRSNKVPEHDIKDILSTCAMCGGNIHLSFPTTYHLEAYDCKFCDYCQAITEDSGWKQLKKLMAYLNRIDNAQTNRGFIKKLFCKEKKETIYEHVNSQAYLNLKNASIFRVRLKLNNGNLLYKTLDSLRIDESGELYIVHEKDKTDKVKFAGVYLQFRDKNGKRIYEGDIVSFNIKYDYQKEWSKCKGLAAPKHRSYMSRNYPFMIDIYDGWGLVLPPLPSAIDYDSIEVVGNLFETPELYYLNSNESIDGCLRFLGFPPLLSKETFP